MIQQILLNDTDTHRTENCFTSFQPKSLSTKPTRCIHRTIGLRWSKAGHSKNINQITNKGLFWKESDTQEIFFLSRGSNFTKNAFHSKSRRDCNWKFYYCVAKSEESSILDHLIWLLSGFNAQTDFLGILNRNLRWVLQVFVLKYTFTGNICSQES